MTDMLDSSGGGMTNSAAPQTIDAVIFDFNSTLFWDAAFHDEAWSRFGDRHGIVLTPTELDRHVLGFTNKEILSYLFGRPLNDGETNRYSREKESCYREICRANPDRLTLAPGAEVFLDFLKRHDIGRAIASASIDDNIAFFFDTFELNRWFDLNCVVYDDGAVRGKPHPDMFIAASRALDVPLSACMVVEDSRNGLLGAVAAGAGRLVAIASDPSCVRFDDITGIDQIVSDFRDIDRFALRRRFSR